MNAYLDWVAGEAGGRELLPSGDGPPYYSPVIRFLDEPWPDPRVAWSVLVRKQREAGNPRRWLADLEFRVAGAPGEAIREGREFELYEGRSCVARGKFVGDPLAAKGSEAVGFGLSSL
jgi:hypothetical protein